MRSALLIPSRFLPPPALLHRMRMLANYCSRGLGAPRRGFWFWDLQTKELCWDNTMEKIYGMPISPQGYRIGSYEGMFGIALWDDLTRSIVNYNVGLARLHHSEFRQDFRVRDQNTDAMKIIRGVGQWVYDDYRRPTALYGYNIEHRLTPEDIEAVGSALTLEELQHATKHAECPTPDARTVTTALVAFIQCAGLLHHHVR